jgi:flagellar hook-basal body complex protein FliE
MLTSFKAFAALLGLAVCVLGGCRMASDRQPSAETSAVGMGGETLVGLPVQSKKSDQAVCFYLIPKAEVKREDLLQTGYKPIVQFSFTNADVLSALEAQWVREFGAMTVHSAETRVLEAKINSKNKGNGAREGAAENESGEVKTIPVSKMIGSISGFGLVLNQNIDEIRADAIKADASNAVTNALKNFQTGEAQEALKNLQEAQAALELMKKVSPFVSLDGQKSAQKNVLMQSAFGLDKKKIPGENPEVAYVFFKAALANATESSSSEVCPKSSVLVQRQLPAQK